MKKLILALLLASSCAYGTTVFADDSDDVKVSENGDSENESGSEGGNENSGTQE
ncbi:hypothetical protein O1W69_00780 [Chlamydia sp. 12-01]|uniref:hypothetical protein n=1 Tax=Chlamydia sp. 12-01 TaxID=3002742 RepID=UPI0035D46555